MFTFRVRANFHGMPTWGVPNCDGIQIVLDNNGPTSLCGDPAPVSAYLVSAREIDATINRLIGELEAVREGAKRMLNGEDGVTRQIPKSEIAKRIAAT